MNKFNKGKLLGVVAASLSAVSLMGVGFATWIIQGANTINTGEQIQVLVSDTEDKRVTLSNAQISWPSEKNGLVFDAKSNDFTGPIIYDGSENGGEQLNFTLSFDVKFTATASFASINAYMTSDWASFGTYFTNDDNDETKYVVSPISVTTPTGENAVGSTVVAEKNTITTTKSGTTDTYTVTKDYSFSWGKFFDNKNPGEVAEGSNKVDSYISALKRLYELKDKHITIHLGVKLSN